MYSTCADRPQAEGPLRTGDGFHRSHREACPRLPTPGEGGTMCGKDREQRRDEEVARALNHPLRLRILEMHKRERGRSLSVELLTAALRMTRDYREVTAAEVKYHRDRLEDAKLLPA